MTHTQYLKRSELATMLRVSRATLKAWADRNYGPTSLRISQRRNLYKADEVERFISDRKAVQATA